MDYAIYSSKFGFIRIEYENETVFLLKRVENPPEDFGNKTHFTDGVFKELLEYFDGERKSFTFNFELKGTDFQKKVWKELLNIPYGETRSYKDIAKAIGNEKACRAVGMANNKNPVNIVVPCHRVIGTDKRLIGYAGGIQMKEQLLAIEKASAQPQ